MTKNSPFKKKGDDQSHRNEHPDLGNVTPRIVRCITALNVAMGAVGLKVGLRRVHHNAESHRFRMFGAITKQEMEDEGEAFPLTVFQPRWLVDKPSPVQLYKTICTLETYNELVTYAERLHSAGFFVPKSWIWGLPSTLPKAPKDLVKLLKKKL